MNHFRAALLPFFFSAGLLAQDPDIQDDPLWSGGHDLEESFHSSDLEGEQATGRRKRQGGLKRVSVPEGAFRLGAICMDDSYSPAASIGACSGHGGVRYWLYRSREGDTVRVLTGRHERHPGPLDAAEMSAIARRREDRTAQLPARGQPAPIFIMPPSADGGGELDWPDVAGVSALSMGLYFSLRLLLRWIQNNETLVHDALHNLLRPRRRPAPRKGRKNPPKARL